MRSWICLMTIACITFVGGRDVHAEDFVRSGRSLLAWSEAVGERVVVEGIAFGSLEKNAGGGAYVILHANNVIYLPGAKFFEHDADGRLIRASGVLRKRLIKAARPGEAGIANDLVIFLIEDADWKRIDRVTSPWVTIETKE
jgi:hypothetical protein